MMHVLAPAWLCQETSEPLMDFPIKLFIKTASSKIQGISRFIATRPGPYLMKSFIYNGCVYCNFSEASETEEQP